MIIRIFYIFFPAFSINVQTTAQNVNIDHGWENERMKLENEVKSN